MRRAAASALFVWLPGLLFLVSAGAKAWYPESSSAALSHVGIPVNAGRVIIAILPGIEAGLGVALLVYPALRGVRLGSAAVVLVFTGFLALLLASADPPACGCLGTIRLFESARAELLAGVGRNVILLGLLAWPAPR